MVIQAEYLLAVILAGKDSVSLSSLNRICREIEERCPGVAVDVSSSGLYNAVEYYPEIFERRERLIARAGGARPYLSSDYIDCKFGTYVPEHVQQQVQEAVKQFA
jgi:hypothetical protein